MKGWLDKYGKEINANEGYSSAQDNWVGEGYSNVGRNYSPAWGGQFQKGGKLTAKQLDSLNKAKMKSKMALASEFGNPAARRMMNPTPPSYRFSGNEMIDGQNVVGFGENQVQLPATGTHYMGSMGEYAVPYIQQSASGNLQFNPNASPDDREAMKFDNPQDAEYFAEHYKEVAPMMQSFAMGGSLPGSVGFTYARTGGIPSNGPYAKKTKASAQDGKTIVQNLNLPIYEEGPKNFLTGYGYGFSPDPNVKVYGVGAYGETKVSPRTTLSGNMSSQSVTYPGGDRMFMKPTYNVGMRYRFDNGGSMSYYQHGLDWKPKSMQTGGWLDKYTPQAQTGKFVLPDPRDLQRQMVNASESTAPTSKQTTTGVSKENMASSTRDMGRVKQREREEEKARVKERQSAKAIKEGKAKTFTFPTGESKSLDQMDAREKAYVTGKSIEGKGRFFENEESIIDDLNPLTWISEAAGALGAAPYEAREYDSNLPYAGAIGSALFQGALGFDPLGGAIKFAKNPVTKSVAKTLVDIPRAENIKEAIGRVGGIPLKKDIPRMGAQDVKALRQVQEIGRLRATNSPMAEQMKYGLENDLPEEHFQKVFGKSREEAQHLLNTGFGEQEAARSASIRESIDLRRPSRPNAELARLREQNRFEPVEMTPEEMAISNRGADLDLDLGANDVVDFNPESIVRQSQRDAMRARFREFDAADEAILSESDMLNLSNQNIDRSQAVQNIVDRFSEPRLSYTQLSPEAVERIQRYSRELDNQLPPPPEYINLNIDNPRRGRTIIPGQERSRLPLSQELKRNINDQANKLDDRLGNLLGKNTQNYPYYSGEVLEKVPSLSLSGSGSLKNVSKKVNFAPEGIQSGDIFTGSTNTSHSSYLPQLKQVFKYTKGDPQFLGYRPMNTMGFLSQYGYGEGDIAKYLNSEIDEQIKRGIIPKDISRPFQKGERVMLPHYGVKQHRQGGVIEDDMGQWAHPGKITKINSNQITMKGVDYPVLGISDAGDQQMMYPDQEYTFKGKTVTEYPQKKKNGGWLEKYN